MNYIGRYLSMVALFFLVVLDTKASRADTDISSKIYIHVAYPFNPDASFVGDTTIGGVQIRSDDPDVQTEMGDVVLFNSPVDAEWAPSGSLYLSSNAGRTDSHHYDAGGSAGVANDPSDPFGAVVTASFSEAGYWDVLTSVHVSFTDPISGITCSGDAAAILEGEGDLTVSVYDFKGLLVPSDDFTSRSHLKLGLMETGALHVALAGATSSADLKPLTWAIESGDGVTLSGLDTDSGSADFVAADHVTNVTLSLTDKNGRKAILMVDIVAPAGGYCERPTGSGVWHIHNRFSVGIKTNFFVTPKDVSFNQLKFKEGDCPAATAGWFVTQGLNFAHNAAANGWIWMPIGNGNATKGCQVQFIGDFDYASLKAGRHQVAYAAGTFNWPIPWLYSTDGGTTSHTITTMNQLFTVDAVGHATVSKGGASGANDHGDASHGF